MNNDWVGYSHFLRDTTTSYSYCGRTDDNVVCSMYYLAALIPNGSDFLQYFFCAHLVSTSGAEITVQSQRLTFPPHLAHPLLQWRPDVFLDSPVHKLARLKYCMISPSHAAA